MYQGRGLQTTLQMSLSEAGPWKSMHEKTVSNACATNSHANRGTNNNNHDAGARTFS